MKNLMKRIISTALSVCMLITMFSMLGTVAANAAAEYDIGVEEWLPKIQDVEVSTLDISDQLEHYHQVIVVCKSEDEMKELCEQLKQEGLKCNTLTL